MKDRLVTSVGALLAIAVVYTMFFQREPPAPFTRPLSTETGPNGYSAVRSWLESKGVRVVGLTRRYDRLDAPDGTMGGASEALPATGNVLITAMPHRFPARVRERNALHRWIDAGNTLLVFAALDDTPEWDRDGDWRPQLTALTGLGFDFHRDEPAGETGQTDGGGEAHRPDAGGTEVTAADDVVELLPVAGHPLMDGVERLSARSDRASAVLYTTPTPRRPLLRLAVEARTGVDAAWQLRRQDGQIIVVASAAVLSNRNVGDEGVGRFIANVLNHHLGADGAVIFDDMHQGRSTLYDPTAFAADSRVHATIGFLLAAWLTWLLGSSNRLTPPLPEDTAPRHRDFLAAAGGLLARRLDRRDAGLLLLEDWFDEIRRKHALQQGGPPWSAIDAMPALRQDTRDAVRRAYQRLRQGRRVDLVALHNTLREARKAVG